MRSDVSVRERKRFGSLLRALSLGDVSLFHAPQVGEAANGTATDIIPTAKVSIPAADRRCADDMSGTAVGATFGATRTHPGDVPGGETARSINFKAVGSSTKREKLRAMVRQEAPRPRQPKAISPTVWDTLTLLALAGAFMSRPVNRIPRRD